MRKPNIILIIAEELGHGFLGYAGNEDSETPFLDQLSRSSCTFHQHYTVHGKCVPSRSALYSGRYCHNGGHRTLGVPLSEGEISMARILKSQDYHNILVGKNHTIAESCLMDQFDEHWQGGINGKEALDYSAYKGGTTSNGREAGNPSADNYVFGKLNLKENEVIDYLHTERVCDFLENNHSDQPFFINLNYAYTHPPYEVMEPYYTRFMEKDLNRFPSHPGSGKPDFVYRMCETYGFDRLDKRKRKEMMACYLGQLSFLDNRVREIYESLEASGLLENTVLIFTSDHGDLVGHYGLGEKWDTLFADSIVKVPLMVHCPCRFEPRHIHGMTESIDLMPTLLELVGAPVPYGVQGRSLNGLLAGKTETHREYVFAEGGHEKALLDVEISPDPFRQLVVGYLKKAAIRELYPDSLRKAKMIRTKTRKLVHRVVDRSEFYDLEKDPLEMTNCFEDPAYQDQIHAFKGLLLNHLIETEENLPFDPEPIS